MCTNTYIQSVTRKLQLFFLWLDWEQGRLFSIAECIVSAGEWPSDLSHSLWLGVIA